MGWLYYLHFKQLRCQDPQYQIIALMQSTQQAEELKTAYLAELLDLCIDKPTNLYHLDRGAAEQKLLNSPVIKQASVKKILPGTLFVSYQMRQPIVYLQDFHNAAIDQEGYLFPFSPFFTPKNLPSLYLGLENVQKQWGDCLEGDPRLILALKILESLKQKNPHELWVLKTLDLSQAFADSYGQRQIVMVIEERLEKEWQGKNAAVVKSYLVRLDTENYKQGWARFLVLKDYLNKRLKISKSLQAPTSIIDLRLPQLAFIQED